MHSNNGPTSTKLAYLAIITLGLGSSACGTDDGEEPFAGNGSSNASNGAPANGGDNTGGSTTPPGNGENGGSGETPFECESMGLPVNMVRVPGGEFTMGCNEEVDADCVEDEYPQRTIDVSAFEIDETEVTQDQYAACVQDGSCRPPSCDWDCGRADYPAGCVTREQARTFCQWGNKRLPTEAEWEKAARGTDGRKYPWGNEEPTCDLVSMAECSDGAQPVGAHPQGASPYGALDMGGNMVEMLHDWYDESYYERMPETDPQGPNEGQIYVGRGGGFLSEPFWHRTSVRDWYAPSDAGKSLGFRCAR